MKDEDLLGLDELRQRFEAGEPYALMIAIERCLFAATHGNDATAWVLEEFEKGRARYDQGDARDLGEAFGITRARRTKVPAISKKAKNQGPVFEFIYRAWLDGAPIDECIFSAAGDHFGLSANTAKNYFYDVRRAFKRVTGNDVLTRDSVYAEYVIFKTSKTKAE